MPIRIKVMSWNLHNYGVRRYRAYPLGRVIARLMQIHQIDILALIEIKDNYHLEIRQDICAALGNIYLANWRHTFAKVGNECVAFVWHENQPTPARNFRALAYDDNPAAIAGGVFMNTNNAPLVFPRSNASWDHHDPNDRTNGAAGRPPAFCAFQSAEDPQNPRVFTVLDFHAPHRENSLIQAYSTHLYARSREIASVVTIDIPRLLKTAEAATRTLVEAEMRAVLQSQITNASALRLIMTGVVEPAVAKAVSEITDGYRQGRDLGALIRETAKARSLWVASALVRLSTKYKQARVTDSAPMATALAKAAALAGSLMVTSLIASAVVPQGIATAQDAITAAKSATLAGFTPIHYTGKPPSKKHAVAGINSAAKNAAGLGVVNFVFPAFPARNVHSTVLAGDFNLHYPDDTVYLPNQQAILDGPNGANNNAFSAIESLPATPALNGVRTTITGALLSRRVYTLNTPVTVQNHDASQPNYVPLNLNPFTNHTYLGYTAWENALKAEAVAQQISWNNVKPHLGNIELAFDIEYLNDTEEFRVNDYDNFFLRNAPMQTSSSPDVLSELGTWGGAAGRLNATVQGLIAGLPNFGPNGKQIRIGAVDYRITAGLDNAEQAAVLYSKYISDHFPIVVEIEI